MKFSVLMSVYNNENPKYLDDSFKSIWDDQLLRPDQIVLVQDGIINQNLVRVISRIKSKPDINLKIIKLKNNFGLGYALNKGLEMCDNELVARMDSDDLSDPNRFKEQIQYIKNHDCDILGTFSEEINEIGVRMNVRKMPITHQEIYESLWSSPFIHSSVMFKKSKILSVGSYNIKFKRRQDYDLWFRCAKNGMKFHNLPKILHNYRYSANTFKKQNILESLKQGIIGYRGSSSVGLPFKYRLFCFYPLIRSFLPNSLQHYIHEKIYYLDPRRRK